MAAVIFHGPPGSYKTSSAIWFEMLGHLRSGRIVVTNIEGMKPIHKIEKELNEKFPETADIWRISTQKARGLELMRCFYHWAPIGAQIIIDEVQDVFPVERTFKVENYDYRPIDTHKENLPYEWFKRHNELLDEIKPEDLTDADTDDLGELVFDDNGRIIYPTTLKESFMRHRKYNWDIVVCTPDITQVNMLIRGACEAAFNHSSKDVLGKVIPYFARRPRIRQHPSKESGLQAKKSDIVTYRKVPIDVHKLYKSTSTGKVNSSGVGKSPLSSGRFIAGIVALVGIAIYYVLYFSGYFDQKTVAPDTQASAQTSVQGVQSTTQNSGVVDRDSDNKDVVSLDVFVKLPYQPKHVYLVGTQAVYENGQYQGVQMHFELVTDKGKMFVDDQQIKLYGVSAQYVADCFARLNMGATSRNVYCKPDEQQTQSVIPTLTTQPKDISLFGT